MEGRATDIGIGADGSVWVTTLTDDWGEDGKLAMLQGTNWITQSRSSAAVSVHPGGMPWFTQGDGDVLRGLGYEGYLDTPVVSGGQVALSFYTLSDTDYVVQVRPDLASPWTELEHLVGTGDKVTVTHTPSPEAATSFYGVFLGNAAPAAVESHPPIPGLSRR